MENQNQNQKQNPDEMPFLEHLAELRKRIIYIIISIVITFFIGYALRIPIFKIIVKPITTALQNVGITKLSALQVTETIFVYMKIALLFAVVASTPVIFYNIWKFVAPGLYENEKKLIGIIVIPSILFFVLGVIFAYFVMIPFVAQYLIDLSVNNPMVEVTLTIKSSVSFVITFLLIFGFIFELPLAMGFLSFTGIFGFKKLVKAFKYVIIAAFFLGAVFTPPDPISQTLMAIPIILLYAIGLFFAFLIETKNDKNKREGLYKKIFKFVFSGVVVVILIFVYHEFKEKKEILPDFVVINELFPEKPWLTVVSGNKKIVLKTKKTLKQKPTIKQFVVPCPYKVCIKVKTHHVKKNILPSELSNEILFYLRLNEITVSLSNKNNYKVEYTFSLTAKKPLDKLVVKNYFALYLKNLNFSFKKNVVYLYKVLKKPEVERFLARGVYEKNIDDVR